MKLEPINGIGERSQVFGVNETGALSDKIAVYHGSEKIIDNPVYKGSKAANDYGSGLYLTGSFELAGEWAVLSTEKDGYVNEYMLNTEGLKILYLDREPLSVWVATVLENRMIFMSDLDTDDYETAKAFAEKFRVSTREYDLIYGYRADDAFFGYMRSFINNALSLQMLQKIMHFGELGMQIFLQSPKAYENIEYVKLTRVSANKYLKSAKSRDSAAREKYRKMPREQRRKGTLVDKMLEDSYV